MGGGGGGGGEEKRGKIVALQRHTPSIFCLAQLFNNLNYEQSI